MGHLYYPFQDSERVAEERVEGIYKAENGNGKELCDMLPSGHDIALAPMNLQQQRLPPQGLCKTGSISITSKMGRDSGGHPSPRIYYTIIS